MLGAADAREEDDVAVSLQRLSVPSELPCNRRRVNLHLDDDGMCGIEGQLQVEDAHARSCDLRLDLDRPGSRDAQPPERVEHRLRLGLHGGCKSFGDEVLERLGLSGLGVAEESLQVRALAHDRRPSGPFGDWITARSPAVPVRSKRLPALA
jgi:hypothetical protein